MRLALTFALLATAVVGCGPPNDPTPNRAPPSSANYPPGPYGYGYGTIMGNLHFVGKQSDTATDYSQLPMKSIDMSDVRLNGKLIVIDGAARWCTPCNRDQPAMKALHDTYGPKGVVFMEVLVEGGYGVAATDDDINRWTAQYGLSGIVAIDPGFELARYADVTAFPVYMIVRNSNMRVDFMQVDALAASPIDSVLDSLLAQ
jgi:thiol-disulfide isomerase/thioredoxin